MASVSSMGTIYSSITAKNKGIGGLASGLDTESILDALTTGTRSKIARQQQLKQTALWKQTAYHNSITALNAFRDKHLTFSGSSGNTNIGSYSYFNTLKATTTSTSVKVNTTANSTLQDISIDRVLHLASAESISSQNGIKQSLVSGDSKLLEATYKNRTLTLNVDGVAKTIKLDTLDNNKATAADLETELQRLVTEAYGTKTDKNNTSSTVPVIKVSVQAGAAVDEYKIQLENTSGSVTVSYQSKELGFDAGASNRINTSTTKVGDIAGLSDKLVGDTFTFKINGQEFTTSKNENIGTLMTRINNSSANVRMTYDKITDKFSLTSKVTGHSHTIEMEDVQGNFLSNMFGADSAKGVTSKKLYSNKDFVAQGTSDFATEQAALSTDKEKEAFISRLQGYQITMTVGGVKQTISPVLTQDMKDKVMAGTILTDDDIVAAVNAGMEAKFGDEIANDVEFKVDGGKFVFDTKGTKEVVISKGGGGKDGLTALGFNASDSFTNAVDLSYKKEVESPTKFVNNNDYYTKGKTFKLDISVNNDRRQIEYELTEDDIKAIEAKDSDEGKMGVILSKLNQALFDEYGAAVGTQVGSNVTMHVGLTVDKEGKVVLNSNDKTAVVLHTSTEGTDEFDIVSRLGFADGTHNYSDDLANITLAELGVAGNGSLIIGDKNGAIATPIDYDPSMTLKAFMDKINVEAASVGGYATIKDGRLLIEGQEGFKIEESGSGDLINQLFGVDDYTQSTGATVNYTSRGQNAEIMVGGEIISNATNTFTINGTEVEVLEETDGTKPIEIKLSSDPDELIDKLKDFIADYNALVGTITAMVKEKGNKDYTALSDEQKADLSTEEIERWEAEAKKGVVRNDSTLNGILSQLRSVLYNSVGDSGVSLYSIGITTVSILSDPDRNGQLEITADNEEKLRNAIINNPDAVRELFTHSTEGLATKLDAVIDRAVNTSSDPLKRGTLINIAGNPKNSSDTDNTMYRKLTSYDEAIEKLKTRLETEYNRYWKQFSALETAIQNMNSQSSWLYDTMSSQ
ncbi:flagellar filament capping protein FliD [Ruminococcaceae bacterium OttesenSCG-928-L11]|nr:flagellar filament capping protein FliD [Ruminococcaceae bacterium OttesenSCG-928-L11]